MDSFQKRARPWAGIAACILHALIISSPGVIYYLTYGFTGFSPFFLIFQVVLTLAPVLFLGLGVRSYLLLTLPLWFMASLQWGYYAVFKGPLTIGGLTTAISTNYAEVVGFLSLLPSWVIVLCIAAWVLYAAMLIINPGITRPDKRITLAAAIYVLSILMLKAWNPHGPMRPLHLMSVTGYLGHSIQLVHGIHSYIIGLKNYRFATALPAVQPDPGKDPEATETHILVLGESARRERLGHYGYARNTTPFTAEIDGLFVFQDVISATNATLPSIQQLMTKKGSDARYSLIDVAKAGGFSVYWISNQKKYGLYESATSFISERADHGIFTKTESIKDRFDEDILPFVKEAIEDKHAKKLIIVHIMGSHADVAKRYPPAFSRFKSRQPEERSPAGGHSGELTDVLDHYDNSILYTDSILKRIHSYSAAHEAQSSILYLSDHGECLYEGQPKIYGHGGARVQKCETHVPFLLWLSPSLGKKRPYLGEEAARNTGAKISLAQFFDSYLGLLGLRTELRKEENNLFSPQFTEMRPRYIWNSDGERFSYEDLP